MTHIPVEERCTKLQVGVRLAGEKQCHLAKTEQVKVVDQQRSHKHQREAETKYHVDAVANNWVRKRPDYATDWLPEREQGDQQQAGTKHVRAPFYSFRN